MVNKTLIALVIGAGTLGFGFEGLPQRATVPIDSDDIGGMVTSEKGPEAGVWVIAETTDLPTKFVKIVVTDDQGRYVVPDLPPAQYTVWVRGYGLVDSPKLSVTPGRSLNLTAVVAPTPRAAAEYYPANYWYSLLSIPAESEFPGTGAGGNGIAEGIGSQAQFVAQVKTTACETCHQMGNKATREIAPRLGTFAASVDAWDRRLQSGQAGATMTGMLNRLGRGRAIRMFADWTDRIATGEVPPAPPRPRGVERNVVMTAWDYGDGKSYLHDGTSTYKPNPTVNANGLFIAAAEVSTDFLYVVNPQTHTASSVRVPIRDPSSPPPYAAVQPSLRPSPYWGDELIWTSRTQTHSTMWDAKGRLWTVPTIRPAENPAWCKQGSNHPSAKGFPLERSIRQAGMYDPGTQRWTLIDVCFSTHHLLFGEGRYADTLFFENPGDQVLGWLDTRVFAETGDEQRAQGWTPFVLDANGNGRRDVYAEPNELPNPNEDLRVAINIYTVAQNPADLSVWGTNWTFPGGLIRIDLGANPPETAIAEVYDAPWGEPAFSIQGNTPRGLDIDRNGVVWTNLSGSGHLASFDRRKCKGPLNGPAATGKHCPEGWTVYPAPGPQFRGVSDSGSADALYLTWVDQFDTFGLGRNVPLTTGSGSDSLLAFVPDRQEWVIIRVPYPLGFYSKGLDGRVDDPNAGWKGRGLWSTYGTRVPWHIEGGQGTRAKVLKFQFRPHPLAK